MNNVKLIDVTLRDGGYKTNFDFSDEFLTSMLPTLDKTGVHYIEVGYRKGSFQIIPGIGRAGMCQRDYLLHCRRHISSAKLTVMLHPKNVNAADFDEIKQCGVDAVRICFPDNVPQAGFNAIEQAIKSGLEVFVNITRISRHSDNKIIGLVKELSSYELTAIYFADSNGSLAPEKITQLFTLLIHKHPFAFGFHAHDNLFLAQSNAIAAINCGVQFIDSSLSGLGKGAGNLKTEGIAAYFAANGNRKFDLCRLLEISDMINNKINKKKSEVKNKDIIMGIFDLSQDDALEIGEYINTLDYYKNAETFLFAYK